MHGPAANEDVATTGAVRTDVADRLDATSAMVRAESEHLDATLHVLVQRLSSVPGLKITDSHRHGWFRRLLGDLPYINDPHRERDPVQKIAIALGPSTYWLHSRKDSIRCGVDIASAERPPARQELTFAVWATKLFDEIAQENLVNHESLAALRQLVE